LVLAFIGFRISRSHEIFKDLATGLEGLVEYRSALSLQIVCVGRESWRRLVEDSVVEFSLGNFCEGQSKLLNWFEVLIFELTLHDGKVGE